MMPETTRLVHYCFQYWLIVSSTEHWYNSTVSEGELFVSHVSEGELFVSHVSEGELFVSHVSEGELFVSHVSEGELFVSHVNTRALLPGGDVKHIKNQE
jgi:hypothetical protein